MFVSGIQEKYDEKLLENRMVVESSVIGTIYKDFLLLNDYDLKVEDFKTTEGRFLFSMANKLNESNISTLTEFDLMNNFTKEQQNKFNELGGFELINSMQNNLSIDNATKYIDDLYKENAILQLVDGGFDLFKEVNFNGKNVIPFYKFKKYDSQQVKDFYDDYVNQIRTLDLNKGIEEEMLSISDDFIDSCLSGEELGTLFNVAGEDVNGNEIYAFPKISNETGGFLHGSLSMLAGYSSVGKSTLIIPIVMALIHRGEKVCIISNEQKINPFQMNFLMWILTNKLKYYHVTKKKMRVGASALNDEDIRMIKEAQKIFNEEYKDKIYFVSIPSTNMKLAKTKFREYCLRKGCGVFIYDTFKIDFNSGDKDNFWMSLIRDSRELFELAKKYDAIGFATIQCANNTLGQLFLDSSVLSNSKQVKEILENLYIVRDLYAEEMDKTSRYYCKPYINKDKGNGVWEREEVKLDEKKSYKVLFLDKVRSGKNSTAGNYAIILEFYGDTGAVRELCYCMPKRAKLGM